MDLSLARFGGDLEGNVQKQNDNQEQSSCYLGIGTNGYEVVHFDKDFSISTVMSRKIIPQAKFLINNKTASIFSKLAKFGVIMAKPNQPAEMLIDRLEKALRQGLVNNFCTSGNLAEGQALVKQTPFKFAVELNRLTTLNMENAVG